MPVMQCDKSGSQTAFYLPETATPPELSNYVGMFLAAMGASGGRFPTGPRTELWLSRFQDKNGDWLAIVFRNLRRKGGCLTRAYKVCPDQVVMVCDKIGAGDDSFGYHAWFISVHLMVAWIIRCRAREEREVVVVPSAFA